MSLDGTGNPTYGGLLQSFDRFGLPIILDLLSETQRTALNAEVIDLMPEMYTAAVKYLGEECARDAWQQAARRRRGRQEGKTNTERDELAIRIYDAYISSKGASSIKSAPRKVAEILKLRVPELFGATEPSIEQYIRRLLKARDRNHAAKAEASRRVMDAMMASFGVKEIDPCELERGHDDGNRRFQTGGDP